jgi:hypothetical protein
MSGTMSDKDFLPTADSAPNALEFERPDLDALSASAKDYASASRAEGTRKEYAKHWAGFSAWCAKQGLCALPPDISPYARSTVSSSALPAHHLRALGRGDSRQQPAARGCCRRAARLYPAKLRATLGDVPPMQPLRVDLCGCAPCGPTKVSAHPRHRRTRTRGIHCPSHSVASGRAETLAGGSRQDRSRDGT